MPSAGCGKPAGLTSGRASIDVAGKMREYILAVPSNYDQNKPYRLIFGWHPWGGSAQQIAQQGLLRTFDASNGQAILVAPEGQDYQDNGLGWGNANGEDVAFYHAMCDRFSAELCIDQNRIFSTGFSFGAMFSFTLACTEISMMRAIAPQAGNATTSGRCENGTRSVATMAFIGVDDTPALRSPVSGSNLRRAQRMHDANDAGDAELVRRPQLELPAVYLRAVPGLHGGLPRDRVRVQGRSQFAPSAGATLWNFFSQF